jgi:hypothetical protein
MGFRERQHLPTDAIRALIAGHARGRFEGIAGVRLVIVDGVPTGLWERTLRAKRVELRVTPTRTLTKAERRALDDEVNRIGAFLGLTPALTLA